MRQTGLLVHAARITVLANLADCTRQSTAPIQTRIRHERYGDLSGDAGIRIPGQISGPTDGTETSRAFRRYLNWLMSCYSPVEM